MSLRIAMAAFLFLSACGKGEFGTSDDGTQSGTGTPGAVLPLIAGDNVMPVKVGNCGPNGYFNEPCVSVTICTPGTGTCQTIPNVLLDTGSFGLRLFASVITIPLSPLQDASGKNLAECAQFGSGAEWGQVANADVVLGGEPAVRVPIEVVNSSFASVPANCEDLDSSPQTSGFNGILGVGLFQQDCGTHCTQANNGVYFSCGADGCVSVAVALTEQVTNPISLLPSDNNGVILQLPTVPAGGVISVGGNLILGIGTQANNTPPSTVATFPANNVGNFTTNFGGQTFSASFIDSGSNGLFFPSPAELPTCENENIAGFFCPAALTSFLATQMGTRSATAVSFQITNAESALTSGNAVFSDIGGTIGGNLSSDFDWGLPFFLGRTIYVGLSGKSSPLGSGAYWAY